MGYTLGKIQKRSTEQQAADMLREGILSGAVPLGARLTEVSSAEQLGVSRSTIRTAFHQLVQEGLVVQVPYTGWTVLTLSAHDAWELYTLRVSLETLAARLAAARPEAGAPLAGAMAALETACASGDPEAIAAADMALHQAIVDHSGHGRLAEQYGRIKHQISIYIRSSDALVADPQAILDQHRPFVDALIAGDGEAAVAALTAHIESEGAKLVEYLS
jgi:DNA-binding GntR family transcriptional regulator